MNYDFKTLVNRRNRYSRKWEMMDTYSQEIADKGIPPFSVADYDFKYPDVLIDEFKSYVGDMVFGYTSRNNKDYYNSFINWMQRRYNFSIKAEWIIDGNGIVESICNSIKTFSNKGDGVIIMTPVYPPFAKSVTRNERKLLENKLINNDGKYSIDFDLLEKQCQLPDTKLIILCSPHNPVGRVWTRAELDKIEEITRENNVVVVSDEVHMDLLLGESKFIPFASLSDHALNNTITLTAASKSFNLAGTRTSMVIIANEQLRNQYQSYTSENCHIKLNIFGFKLVELAYNKCEGWFDEFLQLLSTNFNLMKTYLNTNHPEIVVTPLEGTYLLWLDFREYNLSDRELFDFLAKECLIFANQGDVFGDNGQGFVRWNIATPTWVLEEALERLSQGLKKLKNKA